MTGKYVLSDGKQLIGYSDFENSDPAMGIRMGCFLPDTGYQLWEPVIQELSISLFVAGSTAEGSDDRLRLQNRIAELQSRIDGLSIHVETRDGLYIETAWVSIEDFAHELGHDARQVTICVADSDTYAQFFD